MKKRKLQAHYSNSYRQETKEVFKRAVKEDPSFADHYSNRVHGFRNRVASDAEHKLYKKGVLIPATDSLYYIMHTEEFTRTRKPSYGLINKARRSDNND